MEPAVPFLDENGRGLWIPPRLRHFERGIVFRTPRGTIQHFGSGPLDAYYPMVRPDDFGDPDELYDCRNPDLAPNKVSIKPYGLDAEVFELDVPLESSTDAGTKPEEDNDKY